MARRIQFGDWIFDPEADQLQLGNEVHKIEPRVSRLLAHFLSHQNHVFTHSQLIDAVWDGRVVSDAAVRRCVSALRRNLARDGSQHCIRTIPKKGYLGCFPSPDEEPPIAGPRQSANSNTPGWRRFRWVSLLFLAAIMSAWLVRPLLPAASDAGTQVWSPQVLSLPALH